MIHAVYAVGNIVFIYMYPLTILQHVYLILIFKKSMLNLQRTIYETKIELTW